MPGGEPLVLVVEDDPAMMRFIRRTLEINDLNVVAATDGPSALSTFRLSKPDLLVLDITIPGIDGLEVCRRVKSVSQVPIIMVTAHGGDEDIVQGFENGADDYLAKPFAGGVLVARVKALMRRPGFSAGTVGGNFPTERFECGGLVLDLPSRRVSVDDQTVHLTPIKYKLLTLLCRHQGKVLTSLQILSDVWGDPEIIDMQVLRTHIARLRKKLRVNKSSLDFISTEPGGGYCLVCPPTQS